LAWLFWFGYFGLVIIVITLLDVSDDYMVIYDYRMMNKL